MEYWLDGSVFNPNSELKGKKLWPEHFRGAEGAGPPVGDQSYIASKSAAESIEANKGIRASHNFSHTCNEDRNKESRNAVNNNQLQGHNKCPPSMDTSKLPRPPADNPMAPYIVEHTQARAKYCNMNQENHQESKMKIHRPIPDHSSAHFSHENTENKIKQYRSPNENFHFSQDASCSKPKHARAIGDPALLQFNAQDASKKVPLVLDSSSLHQCPQCYKQYSSNKNLQRHILTHTNDTHHNCPHCLKPFSLIGSVRRHVARVHLGERKFSCPECGKTYFEKQSMQRHVAAVHHNEKPYVCSICSKCFTRKSSLVNHVKVDHPNDSKRVEEFLLHNREAMDSSSESHSDGQTLTCHHCLKSFTQPRHVQRHIAQVHLGEKNHECTQCGMKFFEKQSMGRHVMAVHDKVKPHVCDTCGKSFARRSSLRTHQQAVHDFVNAVCNGQIIASIPVNRIVKPSRNSVPEKQKVCDICSKQFPSPSKLRRHLLTHSRVKPYSCSVCLRGFTHLGDINRHISRVHLREKNHTCGQCGRQFFSLHSLNNHVAAVHNKERPHTCQQCDKSFARKHRLQCHLKTVHSTT